MAKLSQLTDWISQAINDAPRVRSMMLVSRKRGIFTTGGRGGGAPDMTPRDAANATLLALFDGPTVKSADSLIELGNLPLATVQICPNGPREPERIAFNDKFDERDVPLPGHFKQLPKNALEALTGIFSYHNLPYHLCQVSILKSTITILEITIMDLDVDIETDLDSERDVFECTFKFSDMTVSEETGLHSVNSNRWISGHGLTDLYCLIHGITEADLKARDRAMMTECVDLRGADA